MSGKNELAADPSGGDVDLTLDDLPTRRTLGGREILGSSSTTGGGASPCLSFLGENFFGEISPISLGSVMVKAVSGLYSSEPASVEERRPAFVPPLLLVSSFRGGVDAPRSADILWILPPSSLPVANGDIACLSDGLRDVLLERDVSTEWGTFPVGTGGGLYTERGEMWVKATEYLESTE